MLNQKANASPRVSGADVNLHKQGALREPAVGFEGRPDDWLASGDWLAAGERFKSHPPKHQPH
jgi:hypothetical protein